MFDEWTLGTLKVHFDALLTAQAEMNKQRFAGNETAVNAALIAQEKAVKAALDAAQQAVDKAEKAAEKRFDNVNEFRQVLTDQTQTFIPRVEADQRITSLENQIDQLTTRLDKKEGHSSGINAGWAILIAVAAVVIPLILVLTR